MENNKSDISAEFSFGKTNTNESKQTPNTGSTPVAEKPVVTQAMADEARNNKEYIDHRSITIALVKNYSKFREANRTALPKRIDYIGSSVSSSRILSSNKKELDAYFPQLIGVSPSDNNYITRIKQYLNNIQIKVDELGKTFDISFHYDRYADYLEFTKKEEAIEARYKAANRQNLSELRAALKQKITALNELESTKYKFGKPVNLEDYLMYRHCLLYNDIAKDTALINSDKSIRFYFKDDKKEADKLKKYRTEINKAKINYVSIMADTNLFDAVYIQYCVLNNLPVVSSMLKDSMTKEIELDKFSQNEPVKFNKLCSDSDIKLRSTIEHLIARGILIRSQYSQNITTTEGTLIGANMLEALAWFKNVENTSAVEAYYNQLKNI